MPGFKKGFEYIPSSPEWEDYAERSGRLRGGALDECHHELAQTIDIAAEGSARLVRDAMRRPLEMIRRRNGSCFETGLVLHEVLGEAGIETEFMRSGHPWMTHLFLRTAGSDGEVIYIDPTWQQFLPESASHEDYPDTLIVSGSQMPHVLEELAVPQEWRAVWLDAQSKRIDWRHMYDSRLEELFRIRGWS